TTEPQGTTSPESNDDRSTTSIRGYAGIEWAQREPKRNPATAGTPKKINVAMVANNGLSTVENKTATVAESMQATTRQSITSQRTEVEKPAAPKTHALVIPIENQ